MNKYKSPYFADTNITVELFVGREFTPAASSRASKTAGASPRPTIVFVKGDYIYESNRNRKKN